MTVDTKEIDKHCASLADVDPLDTIDLLRTLQGNQK
jgi:hypothetical protein